MLKSLNIKGKEDTHSMGICKTGLCIYSGSQQSLSRDVGVSLLHTKTQVPRRIEHSIYQLGKLLLSRASMCCHGRIMKMSFEVLLMSL